MAKKNWIWWLRWFIWTKLDDLAWTVRPRFPEFDNPPRPVIRCDECFEAFYEHDDHMCGEVDGITEKLPPWHERPLKRELHKAQRI